MLYLAAAIAIGACLSLQPPINALMARTLNSTWLAASISIAISLILAVAVWMTWGKGAGDPAQVKALPLWVCLGGIAGVIFVAGGVIVAPRVGVASFFVCVVAGQLLGSMVTDQFGAFGMPMKPVNTVKLVGLGLVLAGAALARYGDT